MLEDKNKGELFLLKISELNIDEWAQELSQLYFAVHSQRRNPAYWRWRYLNGPFGKSNLIIAVRGQRVVGMFGLFCLQLVVRGKVLMAGLMEDFYIHPSHRSWICFRDLIEMNIRESQKSNVTFNFGISHSSITRFSQRFGANKLGYLPVSLGFLNVTKVLEGRGVPRTLAKLGCLIQPIVGLKIKEAQVFDLEIRAVENFDGDFDEIWSSIVNSRCVTVMKNTSYLNWRYTQCPGQQYRRLAIYQGKRFEGLVIFCINSWRNGSLILELIARDDNPQIIKALLSQTLRELKFENKGYITASFPINSKVTAVLREFGFKLWGTKIWSTYVITDVNPLIHHVPELCLQNWDFSLGDWGGY